MLMSYIQHATWTPSQSHDEGDDSLDSRPDWHVLLDAICVLCDFEPAADSFIALAVEQDSERTCFWIALNGSRPGEYANKLNAPKQYLRKILKLLKQATNAGGQSRIEIIDEMTDKSVRQSSRKMHNYHMRFAALVASADSQHKAAPIVSAGKSMNLAVTRSCTHIIRRRLGYPLASAAGTQQ